MIWKIIFSTVVSWFLDLFFSSFPAPFKSNLHASMLFLFVVAEAHVQKHSLQTAQNLLQEEVAHAEEHSEVKTHRRAKAVKTELVSCRESNSLSSRWQHSCGCLSKAFSLADSPPSSVQSDLESHEACCTYSELYPLHQSSLSSDAPTYTCLVSTAFKLLPLC